MLHLLECVMSFSRRLDCGPSRHPRPWKGKMTRMTKESNQYFWPQYVQLLSVDHTDSWVYGIDILNISIYNMLDLKMVKVFKINPISVVKSTGPGQEIAPENRPFGAPQKDRRIVFLSHHFSGANSQIFLGCTVYSCQNWLRHSQNAQEEGRREARLRRFQLVKISPNLALNTKKNHTPLEN